MYRRPYELAKVRHVACMEHRALAQKITGITEAQKEALKLGSVKGENYRTGYKHRPESKKKASESHKRWCAENPERLMERASKIRAEKHYRWNGGSTRLNISIRQMVENRKWMLAVRARDGKCVECWATELLEAHHITPLAVLLQQLGVKNRDGARVHASVLWNVDNGRTLCRSCHYSEHGRTYCEDQQNDIQGTPAAPSSSF